MPGACVLYLQQSSLVSYSTVRILDMMKVTSNQSSLKTAKEEKEELRSCWGQTHGISKSDVIDDFLTERIKTEKP